MAELYGTDVSPDLISRVTDAVLDEVREWQNRPLDPIYPVVFFDALRVKIRDEGLVKNKAVYVALALNPDGAGSSNDVRCASGTEMAAQPRWQDQRRGGSTPTGTAARISVKCLRCGHRGVLREESTAAAWKCTARK